MEILFPILFFAGLFVINPLSSGMTSKQSTLLVIGYIAIFVVAFGLISRVF
jgi:hypothetical protein